MVSTSGGVRAWVGAVSGRPLMKVGHPLARRIGRNPRETTHLGRVLHFPHVRRVLHSGVHPRGSRAIRPLVDASGSRARCRLVLLAPRGGARFLGRAHRAFSRRRAASESSWPLRALLFVLITSEVARQQPSAHREAPRASWRLLLAVRGRLGLPNPRRDPRRGPRDAPRAPRCARPQSSGGPPRFGSRMPRNARRRRPRRVTTARRSDVSSAPSRSPSCTPPPSPPWAAR